MIRKLQTYCCDGDPCGPFDQPVFVRLSDHTAAIAALEAAIAAINRLAINAAVASCTCDVKTPDIEFHRPDCRYVTLTYIIEQCENARAALEAKP